MKGAVAIVPAAGAAERFGSAKMLASIGGDKLLERTIRSLLDGGVDRVVVVLGPDASDIRNGVPALDARGVRVATNRRPERGMLSSIQAGLRDTKGDPILVLPGDMPYVEPATVSALLREQAQRGGILSPRFDGKRGHPVVMPGSLRDEILDAVDGATLHDVLRAHASERVDLEVYDRGVVRDVDRPSDLEEKAP
ncbi:MAG: nucleotidyltransferase family protein [Candidatus Limnocylindria bacterium]